MASDPDSPPGGGPLSILVAFRRQDQLDIENLLAAFRSQLDLELIRREWLTIAEAEDERMVQFEDMVQPFHRPN